MKGRDKNPMIVKEKQQAQGTTPHTQGNLAAVDEMLRKLRSKRVPAKLGEVLVFIPQNPKVRMPLFGEAPAKRKRPGTDSE